MSLVDDVSDFLVRLGLTVEKKGPSQLEAARRTALSEQSFRYVVADEKPLLGKKNSTLILANHLPAPPKNSGGDWAYYDDFLDRAIQADRLALETAEVRNNEAIKHQLMNFVPQHIAESGGNRNPQDAVTHFFEDWLPKSDNHLLVILAPAGYGKTLLSFELAKRLAAAHIADKVRPRKPVPFLVPFGEFRRVASFEGMILSSLERRRVNDVTSAAFAYLVARQRIVLFLDGFDELLEEKPSEAQKNLRELIQTLGGAGKVVVTARSTFFRTSVDVADFIEQDLLPGDVQVVELLPFDRSKRATLIAKLSPDQRYINRITNVVESEGIREAMGSPLLLRETVDALLTGTSALAEIGRSRADLFRTLERSVYERERTRHSHRFNDEAQQAMLRDLAEEMLLTNTRGFDMDLVRVAAMDAAEKLNPSEQEIEKLADHHFLTVDRDSSEVRFNHQVFREYFQALAVIDLLRDGRSQAVVETLSKRPLPEQVAHFLAELGASQAALTLLDALGTYAPATLINNIGKVTSAYRDRVLFEEFLRKANSNVPLSILIRNFDLAGVDFSGRILERVEFVDSNLERADFSGVAAQEIGFHNCRLVGAVFKDSEIQSASFDFKQRLFGSLPVQRELTNRGAECGIDPETEHLGLEEKRNAEIQKVVAGRLNRFYRRGSGDHASTWDLSITERNLLGGLNPAAKGFVASEVIPAMITCGILSRWREHGSAVYRLEDGAKDDARALLEREEVVGRVALLLERLT